MKFTESDLRLAKFERDHREMERAENQSAMLQVILAYMVVVVLMVFVIGNV